MNHYGLQVYRDFILNTLLDDKIAFLDEHLFGHIQKFPEEVNALEERNSFLNNRFFIVCLAEPSWVIKNIKKRKRTGKILSQHVGKSDEELAEVIQQRMDKLLEESITLQKMGGKVLILNATEALDENVERIDEFLRINFSS